MRCPLQLTGDELLPAVDVVGCAGEGGVGHDVYGERCNVGWCDDAPDGERGAKLLTAVFELVAEERCRQRCVDEAGGDEVDSDGREFEREAGGEGAGSAAVRAEMRTNPLAGRRTPVPPMKRRVPPGRTLFAA